MIIGNLGRDPELRYTADGSTDANFSVATTYKGKDAESTEWHKIVAFGRLGEICGEYLRKGKQVYIEGRLQTRKWTGKDGNDKYSTEIVATDMRMLGSKGEDAPGEPSKYDKRTDAKRHTGADGQTSNAAAKSAPNDDIPF